MSYEIGMMIITLGALGLFLAVSFGFMVVATIIDKKEQRNLDLVWQTNQKQQELNEKLKHMGFHQ